MHRKLPYLILALLILTVGCVNKAPEASSKLVVEEGVSRELAEHRKNTISDLKYDLKLEIPAEKDSNILGQVVISFSRNDPENQALQIDFAAPESAIHYVGNPRGKIDYRFEKGHIIIAPEHMEKDVGEVSIEFTAGNGSLNRNAHFLYTLFVPDRAHEAFPCFDQPNLKARYTLELDVPDSWTAVANSPGTESHPSEEGHRFIFSETLPISTYLFSFAAGEFDSFSQTRNGREMLLYHREDDSTKVAHNLDAIFDLHFTALEWLENYTGIAYPFEKFDFVLVPSFQYGGMEHPGAILYRAASLFLEENATQDEQLRRASLIAHETAHMWFGDLVTMDWFDDVWLKEVFANFMAAKIVNPAFPDVNHDLRFFFAHYPDAYAIDRSEGTHPIRQELANLKDAGTLYGAIIYKKAPIVMRQLELLIGKDAMQTGLQEYLKKFAFGNAVWGDLVQILDAKTKVDLQAWSEVWVEKAGRPVIKLNAEQTQMQQVDPSGEAKLWPQQMNILTQQGQNQARFPLKMKDGLVNFPGLIDQKLPELVLFNADGYGYGEMQIPETSIEWLVEHLHEEKDPLVRGTAMASLWDAYLSGRMKTEDWLPTLLQNISQEENSQNLTRNLSYLYVTYWKFLFPEDRKAWSPKVNATLWNGMQTRKDAKIRLQFFRNYRGLAEGEAAVGKLHQIWEQQALATPRQALGERDVTTLALELAVREHPNAAAILDAQADRIDNPDRKARFDFVRPALSADVAVRDEFFATLKDPANRAHEPWVLAGLRYLHHPLRAPSAEKHLLPSLELLEEIQQTGDIFFPKRWVDATFSGHQSASAAQIVRDFLSARPDYPYQLRRKILQGADLLLRVATVRGNG